MHPESTFFIYNKEVYINNQPNITGSNASSNNETYRNVPAGFVSLYEMNINREGGDSYGPDDRRGVRPFIDNGTDNRLRFKTSLKNLTGEHIGADTTTGQEEIYGTYPLSASITREHLTTSQFKNHKTPHSLVTRNLKIESLYNIGKAKYSRMSKRFLFPLETRTRAMNIVNIPSIFYGSSIKKGTVALKYYVTGTLIASAIDERQNGELYSDFGNTSGSVVGLVYYDEGILAFPTASTQGTHFTASYFSTGSGIIPDLDDGSAGIRYDGTNVKPASWLYFGAGASDGISHHTTIASASFSINFLGTSYKNSLTLMCNADKGELNYSNNATYLNATSSTRKEYIGNSYSYYEYGVPIKNVVSSSYKGHSADFQKTTYISKVGIYDENDNLIMVAEMARPYRKEEDKDLTFKLKYDLL